MPLERQVEFRIDLIHGAYLIAKVSSRLVPLEIHEFFSQIQEPSGKEFIQLSSSP